MLIDIALLPEINAKNFGRKYVREDLVEAYEKMEVKNLLTYPPRIREEGANLGIDLNTFNKIIEEKDPIIQVLFSYKNS